MRPSSSPITPALVRSTAHAARQQALPCKSHHRSSTALRRARRQGCGLKRLLRSRLRFGRRFIGLQIAKQIAQLLIAQRVEDFLRHQRYRRCLHFLDLAACHDRAFVLAVHQRHGARRVLHDQAEQRTTILRFEVERLKRGADDCAGIDDESKPLPNQARPLAAFSHFHILLMVDVRQFPHIALCRRFPLFRLRWMKFLLLVPDTRFFR